MSQALDLKECFNHWFDEYEHLEYEDAKIAFMQAARIMAQDTIDTLRDYATACAGLEKESITPEQMFDRVAGNLMLYYTQVLNKEYYETN